MSTTKTAEPKKKPSAFDLTHEKRALQDLFEKKLVEAGGEFTEELDGLYQQMAELDNSIEEKIKTYQWVKRKLEAEMEAWKARYEYWKKVADVDKKVHDARKNNVASVKDRVVMLLRTLDDETVMIDGKKVYLRDFYSVTINDEEAAYTHLREHNLAHASIIVEAGDLEDLNESIIKVHSEMQTPDGEPITLSAEANTAIGRALEIIQKASRKIVFAGGKDINKHAQEMHEVYLRETEDARKRLIEINELLEGADMLSQDSADTLHYERNEIHAYLENMQKVNSIPGAELNINKTVFGL